MARGRRDTIDVPAALRQIALARDGGSRWLRALPRAVAELQARWNVRVGATRAGGTAAFVADATTHDGAPAIVKIALPEPPDSPAAYRYVVEALTLDGGDACARLLAHDDEFDAILLERLGPNLVELGYPPRRQFEVICATLPRLWKPVPAGASLPTGAEKARWLAAYIARTWDAQHRPCSPATIDTALAYADELATAFDRSTAVLVHGDAHGWNTLDAGDRRYKFVDIEGLSSEPAHDLAIPMRELNDELLAGDAESLLHERARFLSSLTGVDEHAIWKWGFVERVANGLYSFAHGFDGSEFLIVAERCVPSPGRR